MPRPAVSIYTPNVPGHATVINLLPIADTDECHIRDILGVDSLTLVQGRDIREKGARGGLKYLREIHSHCGSDVIAINSLDWARHAGLDKVVDAIPVTSAPSTGSSLTGSPGQRSASRIRSATGSCGPSKRTAALHPSREAAGRRRR